MAFQPKLVNKQFNSPIGLYSDRNVREILDRESQMLANGAVGINFHNPMTNKPANLHNSAVLRMLEEEESKQRNGQTNGVKRVAWPPPKDSEGEDYLEQAPIQAQGGAQYSSQSPPGLQTSPNNNNRQVDNRPATPQIYNPGSQSPINKARPANFSPAINSKPWAPVHSPTSPKPFQPFQQESLEPQEPNQFVEVAQPFDKQQFNQIRQQFNQPKPQYQPPKPIEPLINQQQFNQIQQQFQTPQQQQQHQYQSTKHIEPLINQQQFNQIQQQFQDPPVQQYQPKQVAFQDQFNQEQFNLIQQQFQQTPKPAQSPQQFNSQPQQRSPVPQPNQVAVAAIPQQQAQQQLQQIQPQHQPVKQVEPPPTLITLRPKVPISQAPAPLITSQPATATLKGGKNLRGDLKWPPEDVKGRMEAENLARVEIAKGPACRPRRIKKDYSSFFAQHALNSTYPGYKIPPGTQYYDHQPVM